MNGVFRSSAISPSFQSGDSKPNGVATVGLAPSKGQSCGK